MMKGGRLKKPYGWQEIWISYPMIGTPSPYGNWNFYQFVECIFTPIEFARGILIGMTFTPKTSAML